MENPSNKQIGGTHYRDMKIQPVDFIMANGLDYCQANVVKYICRHASKNGREDLEKAKHYIDLLIAHKYPAYEKCLTGKVVDAENQNEPQETR